MINIRDRRMQLGLTMKDLAEMVGVSESAISRWETGDIDNMRRDRIVKLANALKISPIDLLDCNTLVAIPVNNKAGNFDELLVRYANLNPEDQETIMRLLRSMDK